jgi:hypothetical protein
LRPFNRASTLQGTRWLLLPGCKYDIFLLGYFIPPFYYFWQVFSHRFKDKQTIIQCL